MATKDEKLEAENTRLRRVEKVYACQLRREEMIEHVRKHAEDISLLEVDRLHTEREYLTTALAKATGRTVAQVRHEYQDAIGQMSDKELSES